MLYCYQVASCGVIVVGLLAVFFAALPTAWWCASTAASRELTTVDGALGALLLTFGCAIALWYALTALTGLVLGCCEAVGWALPRVQAAWARTGAPLLRRAVITGVGLSLSAAGTAVAAAELPDDLRPGAALSAPTAPPAVTPATVEGSRDPDTPDPDNAGTDGEALPGAGPGARYTVDAGDSLWRIAANHLGDDATATAINAEWRRWHDINRGVIGANPHLIHPGQVLLVPDNEVDP